MMAGSVWDDIPEEDRGFLADWYQTIDEVGWGNTGGQSVSVAAPVDQAAQVIADADARQTYADKLRSYLLRTGDLDRITPPTPLVDRVLYLDSLAWIIGKPGCGKSFIALDWAGHIGSGLRWCGYPVTAGTVLYISPESPGGVRLRVRAWEAAMGHPMDNVVFLPMAVQAAADGHWSALMEVAAELHPVLIILDTQARMTVGLEENAAKDMGIFVDKVERLRAATKACILIVHHTSRGGGHLRGSTAMEGAASTIVTVTKEGHEITVGADPEDGGKTKDVEPFDKIRLRLVPHGDSVVPVEAGGSAIRSAEMPDTVRDGLRRWWDERGTDLLSPASIIPDYFASKSTFYRYVKKLVDSGLLAEEGTRARRLYSMTRQPE